MTSFYLNYLFIGPISKFSHAGSYNFNTEVWGTGYMIQYMEIMFVIE